MLGVYCNREPGAGSPWTEGNEDTWGGAGRGGGGQQQQQQRKEWDGGGGAGRGGGEQANERTVDEDAYRFRSFSEEVDSMPPLTYVLLCCSRPRYIYIYVMAVLDPCFRVKPFLAASTHVSLGVAAIFSIHSINPNPNPNPSPIFRTAHVSGKALEM